MNIAEHVKQNGTELPPSAHRCPKASFKDPRDDDSLINAFPNLIVRPADPDARAAFMARHSIIAGEKCRYDALIAALDKVGSDVGDDGQMRAMQAFYADTYDLNPGSFEEDSRNFTESIRASHATIRGLLETYFPVSFQQRLKMSSKVSSATDPAHLVRLCGTKGRDIVSRIMRFEARRQLTFAQLEFELRLNGCGPERLESDLAYFIRRLDDGYFMSGRSEQVTVRAELDPANYGRVSDFKMVERANHSHSTPNKRLALIPLDVRYIGIPNGNGVKEVPVFFDARVKTDVPLKLVRKRTRQTEILTDGVGVKLVFFSQEDLVAGVEYLRRKIVCVPGSVSAEASNAARAGVLDPQNEHSSSEYRAWKYDVRFRRRTFEIQFMYLPYYVNEFMANGQDNHPLYKLVSYLDRVFPVIFPTELYGFDWRDPDLREALWNLQIAKI